MEGGGGGGGNRLRWLTQISADMLIMSVSYFQIAPDGYEIAWADDFRFLMTYPSIIWCSGYMMLGYVKNRQPVSDISFLLWVS